MFPTVAGMVINLCGFPSSLLRDCGAQKFGFLNGRNCMANPIQYLVKTTFIRPQFAGCINRRFPSTAPVRGFMGMVPVGLKFQQ